MHKSKRTDYSKGSKKRKNEDEYDLQTILDEDATVDDGDLGEPRAAARNAEKNDDGVRFFKTVLDFTTFSKCVAEVNCKILICRQLKTNTEPKITASSLS